MHDYNVVMYAVTYINKPAKLHAKLQPGSLYGAN